ncbi:MAG: hypothetical protein EOO74_03400, partial [Myxococcales bacterium]
PVGDSLVRADGVLLAYGRSKSFGASLYAIDAETGEQLWHAPASPGSIGDPKSFYWEPVTATDKAGRTVTLVVGEATDDDGDGNAAHRLEIREVRSGKVTARPPATWVSDAEECDEGFCVRAWNAKDDWSDATIDPATGTLSRAGADEESETTWEMTDNLTMGVTKDFLRWQVDGERVWQHRLAPYLPAKAAAKDFEEGFTFSASVDDPMEPSILALGFSTHTSPSHTGTVAFKIADGTRLWRKDGMTLCRMGSAVLCPPSKGKATKHVGIDLATGEQQWARSVTTDAPEGAPGIFVDGIAATRDGKQITFLDDRTGTQVELPVDATLTCAKEVTWRGFKNGRSTERQVQYKGGSAVRPCDLNGASADMPLTKQGVLQGADFGTTWKADTELSSMVSKGTAIEDPLDSTETWHYLSFAKRVAAYRF